MIVDVLKDNDGRVVKQGHVSNLVRYFIADGTGDNIATARSIARKCGILTPSDHHLFAMEGPEFKAKVLGADGSVNQDEPGYLRRGWTGYDRHVATPSL